MQVIIHFYTLDFRERKRHMKKTDIATVVMFCGTICTVSLLNLITPDRDFSDMENRSLQNYPKLTMDKLLSGKYSTEMDEYVTDQFIYRDTFIGIKSNTEFLLGKQENNNVFLTEKETLIERFNEPDYDTVDKNIKAIKEFIEAVDVPVYTALIPGQAEIYKELLPDNAPTYEASKLINYTYDKLQNEKTVDIQSLLEQNKEEYIFYNTDHHWTSQGAYYGYCAIVESIGLEKIPLSKYKQTEIASDFNGTVFSKSGIKKAKSDIIYTYQENQEIQVNEGKGYEIQMLYDESYIDEKDKYSLFLGGNDPMVLIEGNGTDKILLLKDSFTNSMVPFFIEQFQEIHVVDLRFTRESISEYVNAEGIDYVVICYSCANFAEDKNIQLLR